MVQIVADIEGGQGVDAALTELAEIYGPRNVRSIFNTPIRRAMEPVVEQIRRETPIDTGELLESVKLRVGKPTATRLRTSQAVDEHTAAEGRAGWFWRRGDRVNSHQALAVEFGTIDQPGKSVLRAALQSNADRVVQTFRKELGDNMRKTAARLKRKHDRGTLRR